MKTTELQLSVHFVVEVTERCLSILVIHVNSKFDIEHVKCSEAASSGFRSSVLLVVMLCKSSATKETVLKIIYYVLH